MKNISNAVHGLKPVIVMAGVQIIFAGVNVLYKLAVNDGMSLRVLVAYRFLFATAFIAPVALIFERKNRPKMTWTVLFQAFLSGLFGGVLGQNLYLKALAFTSATFASAMSNLVPAFTFIMAVCFRCCSYAFWLVVQAKMGEKYPCYYSSTALMSLNASILAIVYALCVERDWSQWRLGWNVRLLTVVYTGTVASGLVVVVLAWCIHIRGPLFVSVFNPLMLLVVAIACYLLLGEKLHLGSIIGAVLIVCGLYGVLWGKGKEMKKKNQLVPAQSTNKAQSPNYSNTVEIVVDNKSSNNNNSIRNVAAKDHNESSEGKVEISRNA
ncbi:hypothetical protein L6164_036268 [Bauhinia variegata]|uniref:Uncharacterized protein n=1 Tax=Bauhinia variegata TaxID=167791 RepID=A0ACB9KGP5_BAUVA|nr:hypothetical protein L6164_036268 [Bauhinia variegata]